MHRWPFEVVTALERGHNLAGTCAAGDLKHGAGGPGEVVRFKRLMGQRITAVGVESGRDQDQVRGEGFEGRHQAAGEGRPP